MAGITFNLILIRVGEGRASEAGDDIVCSPSPDKPPLVSALRFRVRHSMTQDLSISLGRAEQGICTTTADEDSVVV